MVAEMLLSSDIQKQIVQDFTLSKENNNDYVHYFNNFIWAKSP
jgi:hypothetical protein